MNIMRKIHSFYSPLIKGIASELIKWLVGFWMNAMAWRAGWTYSVTDTPKQLVKKFQSHH